MHSKWNTCKIDSQALLYAHSMPGSFYEGCCSQLFGQVIWRMNWIPPFLRAVMDITQLQVVQMKALNFRKCQMNLHRATSTLTRATIYSTNRNRKFCEVKKKLPANICLNGCVQFILLFWAFCGQSGICNLLHHWIQVSYVTHLAHFLQCVLCTSDEMFAFFQWD